jgi:hypothetical protein
LKCPIVKTSNKNETIGDDKLILTNAISDETVFDIEDSNNQEMSYNDNKYIDWSE